MLRYLLLVIAVLAVIGPVRAEDDDATAKRLYELQLEQAEKGDPQAQYYLGEMHEYGLGTPENDAAALDWYRRAASQKHLAAMRKVRELTAVKAKAPAHTAPVEPTPAPAVVAQPAPAKPDPAAEAAKAAAAKAQAARAAAAAKEAQRQAELDAKLAAAEKEKRRAKAKAALERINAEVKKNDVGY